MAPADAECAGLANQEKAGGAGLRARRCPAASDHRVRGLSTCEPGEDPAYLSAVRHPIGRAADSRIGELAQPCPLRAGRGCDPPVIAERTGRERLSLPVVPYRNFPRAIAGRPEARRPAARVRHDDLCRDDSVCFGAGIAPAQTTVAARDRRTGCVLRRNQRRGDRVPLPDRCRCQGAGRQQLLAGGSRHPDDDRRPERVGQGSSAPAVCDDRDNDGLCCSDCRRAVARRSAQRSRRAAAACGAAPSPSRLVVLAGDDPAVRHRSARHNSQGHRGHHGLSTAQRCRMGQARHGLDQPGRTRQRARKHVCRPGRFPRAHTLDRQHRPPGSDGSEQPGDRICRGRLPAGAFVHAVRSRERSF